MKYCLHDLPYMITVRLCYSLNLFMPNPGTSPFVHSVDQDWLAGCFMSQLARIYTGLTETKPPEKVPNWKLFFLFLNENICCEYSKESSQWYGSLEQHKHMLRSLGKKIITILCSKILLYWTNIWASTRFLYLSTCQAAKAQASLHESKYGYRWRLRPPAPQHGVLFENLLIYNKYQ